MPGRHDLNLTKEQKAKVHPILQKAREEVKALRADTSIDHKQKKQQIQAIHQNTAKQLQTILTPEQFQKFQEMKEARKEHKGKPFKGDKAPAPATT